MKLSFAAGFVLSLLGAPSSWASSSSSSHSSDEEENKCRIGSYGPPVTTQEENLNEGPWYTDLKDFLTNSDNFGTNGTVDTMFDILPSTVDASGDYLDGVDIFFSGHAIDDQLMGQEEAILEFVKNGGAAVIITLSSDNLATIFGARKWGPQIHGIPIWCRYTPNAAHPVLNGPFGAVFGQFFVGRIEGGYDEFNYGTPVGCTFLIAIEPGELEEGSGPVFLAAIPAIFHNEGLRSELLNQWLSGNVFAWLAAAVC